MNLICLSRGKGIHFPPCYILNVCGIRILIDCPIDISALSVFSPLCHDISLGYNGETSSFSVDKSGDPHLADAKRQKVEKPLNANDLIHAEPWYKTVASLHLWNVSFIDVVLITSPMGILGLPFLTRADGFSAKIYATEAAAKFGKLMMDTIVSMHTELRQFYGPEESDTPLWMHWEELQLLPFALRERVVGMDGMELGGWLELYSAADIETCVTKVQTVKYAEEVCYNGVVIVKAFSSGSEIGACNWTLKCPDRSIACISNSIFASHHAQEFDYCSLKGNDVIIYMDFSFLDVQESAASYSSSAPGNPASLRYFELKLSDLNELLLHTDESSKEIEKLDFICSCVIDSVKVGGSALIAIDRVGIVLQMLEQLSVQLEGSMLKVPMYLISSTAEEMLALTNVIPEWLCKQRQERLFSGESLFAHVELLKEGRLQVYPALCSPKLLSNWQEPCIAFCPHWNLRLGPAVQLLQRWKGNENSLLVLEERVDSDLDLLPFSSGMNMKVLQCSFLAGITLKNIQPLLELLQPKLVLLPESLLLVLQKQQHESSEKNPLSSRIQHYNVNETVEVLESDNAVEVDLSTELVSQLQWRSNPGHEKSSSIARLKGTVSMSDGRCRILVSSSSSGKEDDGSQPLLCWGLTDVEKLVERLSEMGISATLENKKNDDKSSSSSRGMVVHIHSPDKAMVEVGDTESVIVAASKELGSLIFQAVSSVLDGI